ncbi:MAG: hypothetical protein ACLPGW_12765 [Roseiarcus sp.]
MRAAACAAVVVWQIYEMASASVSASNESDTLRYVVIGAALFGLVASLLKLSADY